MSNSTTETLGRGRFRVTRPVSLDLPSIHGNDYSTINQTPQVLWNFWEKEGAILGKLAGTKARPWYAAYPGVQYVNSHQDSAHMVIAPRRDHFVAPQDLHTDDIVPAAAFIQKFLEPRGERAYAGYNIGPEQNGSQMWWTWHIHLVQFGENELKEIEKKPRIVWEPWPAQIETVMDDVFVNQLLTQKGIPHAQKAELSELHRFGFSSYGSSLLRFPSDISPYELALIMQQADRVYKNFHGELKNIFFEQKDPGASLTKRDKRASDKMLRDYAGKQALEEQTVQHLRDFGEVVLPETFPESSSRNSLLTLPNYSAAILKDEHGVYFLFQPHIVRKKASALSSLGVFLDYTLDTDPQRLDDYRKKKTRNTELVAQINSSLGEAAPAA